MQPMNVQPVQPFNGQGIGYMWNGGGDWPQQSMTYDPMIQQIMKRKMQRSFIQTPESPSPQSPQTPRFDNPQAVKPNYRLAGGAIWGG
jgi:hypothetical protein